MLEFGTIVEIKEGKALARVNILGRVTDFLQSVERSEERLLGYACRPTVSVSVSLEA